jgi:hypothetical protein
MWALDLPATQAMKQLHPIPKAERCAGGLFRPVIRLTLPSGSGFITEDVPLGGLYPSETEAVGAALHRIDELVHVVP